MDKKRKIIGTAVCVLLIAMIVFIVAHELAATGTLTRETSVRAGLALVAVILYAVRFFARLGRGERVNYRLYETEYKDIVELAFCRKDQKKERRQLFVAIDCFNRNRYADSISILEKLMPGCNTAKDEYAVRMFLALSYSDMGGREEAIRLYNEILKTEPKNSRVLSNLAMNYYNGGEFDRAVETYERAIECAPENPYPYNNLASAYIKNAEFEKALPYAMKAYELKNNLVAATNGLAICHSVLGNEEEAQRFFKISVANGADPKHLRQVIEDYKAEL